MTNDHSHVGIDGRGVATLTIRNAGSMIIFNSKVIGQLRGDTSVARRAQVFNSYSEQLDSLFADASVGVSDRIDDFFSSLDDAASNPQSGSLRSLVLDNAGALAQRFNAQYARLARIDSSLNTRIDAIASQIGSLAEGVARLNVEIGMRVGNRGETVQQPNDLLDQRDRLVLQLAELVDVQTVADGSSLNVFLGKGQALVVGAVAARTVTVPDSMDPSRLQLGLKVGGSTMAVGGSTSGGELGGLFAFREQRMEEGHG